MAKQTTNQPNPQPRQDAAKKRREYLRTKAQANASLIVAMALTVGTIVIWLRNSMAELISRLGRARDGLKLLLTAWARYEDEQQDGRMRTAAQDVRTDWGRIARQFLEPID